MLAVLRLRGKVGINKEKEDTLKNLKLDKKHKCIIVKDSQSNLGMIKKVKDYVTYGEVSEDVAKKIFSRENKNYKKGTEIQVSLSPPSKGFKGSIKKPFPKGELGYRGEEINKLLKRMI